MEPRTGRVRPWLVRIGIGLGVVAAVTWWWPRGDAPPTDARPLPAVSAPAPPPLALASIGRPPGPPPPRDPDLPEAVRRYLEATVYPPDSGVLDEGAFDLLNPNARYEKPKGVPGTQGAEPPLTFLWTTDRYRYTSDQVVEARFEPSAGTAPARIVSLEAFAQPEGRGGDEGPALRLRFTRDGPAEVATIDLEHELVGHFGPVRLTARYQIADAPEQSESIRIFVTPVSAIPARFTGSFRADASDGSLLVEAGIDVRRAGFYRIDANLYDAADRPVAWAVYKGNLSERDGVVPLRFFGKVLRDRGAAGPYRLGELRGYLFRDGRYPDRLEMRPWAGTWTTRAFATSEFSEQEWDGEQRQRMVELLMEDVRAGRTLDVPPAALPAPAAPR